MSVYSFYLSEDEEDRWLDAAEISGESELVRWIKEVCDTEARDVIAETRETTQ